MLGQEALNQSDWTDLEVQDEIRALVDYLLFTKNPYFENLREVETHWLRIFKKQGLSISFICDDFHEFGRQHFYETIEIVQNAVRAVSGPSASDPANLQSPVTLTHSAAVEFNEEAWDRAWMADAQKAAASIVEEYDMPEPVARVQTPFSRNELDCIFEVSAAMEDDGQAGPGPRPKRMRLGPTDVGR